MLYRNAMTSPETLKTNNDAPSLGHRTALALYWNFIGRIGIMGGRWAESVLLVWLLGGVGYGLYTSAINLMAFILPFTALGLENGISRFLPQVESDGHNPRPLLRKAAALRVAVCAAVAVGMVAFARPIAEGQLKDAVHWPLVVIVAAVMVIFGLRNIQYRVLVARFEQRFLNGVQVGEIFVMLILAVVLIGLGMGLFGALLAGLAAGVTATLLAGWRIRTTHPPATTQPATKAISIRRMIAFSGTLYAYSLLNTILQKPLDILLLSQLQDDPRQVAYYSVAYMVAFLAASLSGKALAEGITLTIVAEARSSGDLGRLRKIYQMLTEYLYILTFPAVAGLYALGPDLLDLVYGGRMNGAWPLLLLYLPVIAYTKLGGLTANFLAGLDKERWLVAGRVATAMANIALNLWLIPKYAALGAVMATSLATGLGVTFEAILIHAFLRPRYPWVYFAKMTLIALAVGFGAWGVNTALPIDSAWLRLPPAITVGVAFYLAGLWLLKPISADNLKLAATLRLPARKWLLRLLTPKTN